MTTYNIFSFESGRKAGTVKALNYNTAFNICLSKNINVYDDYFIESEETTRILDDLPAKTIYTESHY